MKARICFLRTIIRVKYERSVFTEYIVYFERYPHREAFGQCACQQFVVLIDGSLFIGSIHKNNLPGTQYPMFCRFGFGRFRRSLRGIVGLIGIHVFLTDTALSEHLKLLVKVAAAFRTASTYIRVIVQICRTHHIIARKITYIHHGFVHSRYSERGTRAEV